jgi:hypothetical protein
LKPEGPKWLKSEYAQLLTRCFETEPSKRPKFQEIADFADGCDDLELLTNLNQIALRRTLFSPMKQ